MKTRIIKIFCIGWCLACCHTTMAQEEERYEKDTTERFNEPPGSVHVLRLKKSYVLGEGITFRSAQGNLNINQTLQTLFLVNSANKNLSTPTSQFAINRARLNLFANVFDSKLSLSARLNFSSNYKSATTGNRSFNTVLQEANIEYRPNRKHAISMGLRADYIDSRETRIEGESLGFIERSAVSGAFDAIFDYGIRYKGNYSIGGNQLLRPYVSITSGDSRSGLQKNFGGFKYGIRLDYLPFGKFSRGGEFYMDDLYREEKPKLVVGVVYSYNNGATSATGTNGGRWLYGDATQKIILPNYTKFGFDYLFKYNGFYSMGSFVNTQASVPNGIAGEFRLSGTFSPYPTTQTEEQTKNTVFSRLNLGSGFNVQAGYLFASNWAAGLRYSTLNDNSITANFADQNRHYTFVTTKYLSAHNLKLQFEVGYDELKDNLKTATQNGNYYTQLQFTVQL
jgi:phosphate-selective porin OprO and OprP